MKNQRERLWEDLNDLLLGLDGRFSGPEEAALGKFGSRILEKMLEAGMLPEVKTTTADCELLRAGFESLISDYRISEQDLVAMRTAGIRLCRGASANGSGDAMPRTKWDKRRP